MIADGFRSVYAHPMTDTPAFPRDFDARAPMRIAALLVAAGRGTRAGRTGRTGPKQWQHVAGKRVADWTLAAFQGHPQIAQCVLVIHPKDKSEVQAIENVHIVTGGATRALSVRAGLDALAQTGITHVLIHDVARCTVPRSVIDGVITALETADAAAPAVPVTDALWRGGSGLVSGTVDRAGLFRAQTPQGFRLETICAAHAKASGDEADDVAIARAAGLDVVITQGHENNLKITGPEDFARAEALLETQMDIRLGNGFDVHAFEPGDHVILCGVRVPHTAALKGHSDADVGMHAVTDAIYGALGDGDIGQHFPPSDPQWKGAASHIFLEHACALARQRGFEISNADCTLICEHPKIGPHAAEMKAKMAELMGMDAARVSVKATTSERLGFTGRGEGIAAIATATLVKS